MLTSKIPKTPENETAEGKEQIKKDEQGRKEPLDQHSREDENKCERRREGKGEIDRGRLGPAVLLKANEAFKGSEESKSAERSRDGEPG